MNLSTMATLETEEGGHCGEVGVLLYLFYCIFFFFSGEYNIFVVPSSCSLWLIMVIQS